MQKLIENIMEAIYQADKNKALDILDKYAKEKSYEDAIKDILEPVLNNVGKLWQESFTLAHSYVAGKIAEEFLLKASLEKTENKTENKKNRCKVVIGNIEGDYHSLGRKMVCIFLQTSGWEVYDMGNDVLAEEFVDKAIELDAKIIGASAMMYSNAVNMKKLREELDKRGLSGKIMLAMGGAIFNVRPELVKEFGGDGTTDNAFEVNKLFEKLFLKLKEGEQNE